jgi:hypothetical protein
MKLTRCLLAFLLVASSPALTGCSEPPPGAATGTISLALVGSAPSGTVYRLRDAMITVHGPDSNKVWNTEDAPDQTTLSADVVPGDYTALLADGWRIERLDGATATPVTATRVSDNPARFRVIGGQRTAVPLRFLVDDEEVDLTQGYDLSVTVDEARPPVMVVLNGGSSRSTPPRPPSIAVFPARGDGDLAPLRTIAGPNTTLRDPSDLVVAHDRIIVCDGDAIDLFALSASGNVAPVARIAGPDTGLVTAQAIAVAGGELYVAQQDGTFSTFPVTADGNVAPLRTITNTDVLFPSRIAVAGGEIFAIDLFPFGAHVKVLPASAEGDTSVDRTMMWSTIQGASAVGLAVRGNELFALSGTEIDVLPPDGAGFVDPLRRLSLVLGGFQLAEFRRELYVAGAMTSSVRVFAADAPSTTSASPIRTLGGPSTGLDTPIAVAVH